MKRHSYHIFCFIADSCRACFGKWRKRMGWKSRPSNIQIFRERDDPHRTYPWWRCWIFPSACPWESQYKSNNTSNSTHTRPVWSYKSCWVGRKCKYDVSKKSKFENVEWNFLFVSYYMATLPAEPGVRHLFRKSIENSSANRTCLTCRNEQQFNVGTSNGTLMPCDYSEVIVSPGFDAYVQVSFIFSINFWRVHLQPFSTVWDLKFPVHTYFLYLTIHWFGPWIQILDSKIR